MQKFIKDTDEVLEGVTFEITDKDGKKIEGITNEDGIFDFNLHW
ncbi:SpaA isopeptide-forming pilin-related protein [Erysipelothrix rhusiopathiae]|nr:SpaA isopeptide-forming pilin-related protein [Erysipelothrix rhusiopathiae]